jgi:hypothetical protein
LYITAVDGGTSCKVWEIEMMEEEAAARRPGRPPASFSATAKGDSMGGVQGEFVVELTGVKKAIRGFAANGVFKIANMTMNRVVQDTKAFVTRQIQKEFNIKPSIIRQKLAIPIRSYRTTLIAVITAKGLGIPLIHYGAKQIGVRRSGGYTRRAIKGIFPNRLAGFARRGGAVTVKIKPGGEREIRSEQPPVFLARGKRTGMQVYQRVGRSRYPIRTVLGPGVGGIFQRPTTIAATTRFVTDKFNGEFNRLIAIWRSGKWSP